MKVFRLLPPLALVRFKLRRALLPFLLPLTWALLGLAAARDWGLSASFPDRVAAEALEPWLARAGVWGALALLISPWLVLRAASLAEETRALSGTLLARPISRSALALAELAGVSLAALLLIASGAGAAELASRGGAALRYERTLTHEAVLLLEGATSARLAIAELSSLGGSGGTRLRVLATVAPGAGPAATLVASIVPEGGGGPLARASARVAGRTRLELSVPEAVAEPCALELAREGSGALLVVPADSVELLRPCASARLASVSFGLRLWLVLLAASALAVGLGAWMRPGLAGTLVLTLLWVVIVRPDVARSASFCDLTCSWQRIEAGLVAPLPGAGEIGVSMAIAGVGLLLFVLGLRAGGPA